MHTVRNSEGALIEVTLEARLHAALPATNAPRIVVLTHAAPQIVVEDELTGLELRYVLRSTRTHNDRDEPAPTAEYVLAGII